MNEYGVAVLAVVFGVLLLVLDLALLGLTPSLMSRLNRLTPVVRTDAILVVRSLPLVIAASSALLVFLPSWWRHEPENTGEKVSLLLFLAAVASIAPIFRGAFRAGRMFLRTRDRMLVWRDRSRDAGIVQSSFEVLEVRSRDLALCVGGYLRPTIYASTDVIGSLAPAEFEAALAHEESHARSLDPLRLLWMGSCPDFLPWFSLDAPWRRMFARACEFAADARAVSGNQEVALDLSSALIKVARLGTVPKTTGGEGLEVAVSSATASPVDLRARIEALADMKAEGPPSAAWLPSGTLALVALLATFGAAWSRPAHDFSEMVGRLLAP